MPKLALTRTIKPVKSDRPISRWPYSTRKLVIGAMAGVVKIEKIMEGLCRLEEADDGEVGHKDLMRSGPEKRPRHSETEKQDECLIHTGVNHRRRSCEWADFPLGITSRYPATTAALI